MAESPKNGSDRQYYLFALRIIGDFGATLAVPVVVFALLGKKLDEKFGTSPGFFFAGFVLAAIASGISIYRKSKRYGQEYQNLK